ncbi:tlde1 domain-containing protein [Fulvivirga ligni]|uniref:tlde1 domain-containing protein n=1 Tax=Fulvivirga ligni TaxID=2904246 RepID=UPI001F2459AD|nr:tlde1 domain-containing protein [Fulvivirga ligni]UII20381.1 DUF2778 domain-containing protein [Fulvivirga ligni]
MSIFTNNYILGKVKRTRYAFAKRARTEIDGIYDEEGNLAVNQILVIEGVFTGGKSEQDGITYGNDENQLPIPEGRYEILDYNSDSPGHQGWYRVDAIDNNLRNDIYDDSSVKNKNGDTRRNFRAHIGGLSWGCITFDRNNENAVKGYNVFSKILENTSTRQVRDRMGLKNRLGLTNTSVTRYGTVKVK